jgi:hypothetical protein
MSADMAKVLIHSDTFRYVHTNLIGPDRTMSLEYPITRYEQTSKYIYRAWFRVMKRLRNYDRMEPPETGENNLRAMEEL